VRTQVAIIGAGPAGLLLAQLLDLAGIDSVLIERQSAQHVASRIRAGILEASSVEVLTEAGVADRMTAEGLRHDGVYLQWPDQRVHIDFTELAGRSVWVYGQTEVTRDLMAAREQAGQAAFYEASHVEPTGADEDRAYVSFVDGSGSAQRVDADVVVGCDGYHGPTRQAMPTAERRTWERNYPFAWLGVLADVAPSPTI